MLELYFLLHLSPLISPIVLTYYKFINNRLVTTNVVTFIVVESEGGWLQKLQVQNGEQQIWLRLRRSWSWCCMSVLMIGKVVRKRTNTEIEMSPRNLEQVEVNYLTQRKIKTKEYELDFY